MTEKSLIGLVMVIILAILLMVGWYFGQDGILSATVVGIIGLICGSVFGFVYGFKGNSGQTN